jgi:hypothetical protein
MEKCRTSFNRKKASGRAEPWSSISKILQKSMGFLLSASLAEDEECNHRQNNGHDDKNWNIHGRHDRSCKKDREDCDPAALFRHSGRPSGGEIPARNGAELPLTANTSYPQQVTIGDHGGVFGFQKHPLSHEAEDTNVGGECMGIPTTSYFRGPLQSRDDSFDGSKAHDVSG